MEKKDRSSVFECLEIGESEMVSLTDNMPLPKLKKAANYDN